MQNAPWEKYHGPKNQVLCTLHILGKSKAARDLTDPFPPDRKFF